MDWYAVNPEECTVYFDFNFKSVCRSIFSQYFEDNADAHLKRSIMGREVVIAITNGKLENKITSSLFLFVSAALSASLVVYVALLPSEP